MHLAPMGNMHAVRMEFSRRKRRVESDREEDANGDGLVTPILTKNMHELCCEENHEKVMQTENFWQRVLEYA